VRSPITREATDLFLTLVALMLAAATFVLVFGPPPALQLAAAEPDAEAQPTAPAVQEPPPAPPVDDSAVQAVDVLPPVPTPTVTPTAEPVEVAAVSGYQVYADPYAQIYSDSYRDLATLIGLTNDPYARLVVRPIDRPDLEINFHGELYQNAASTLKTGVLLYAIFRDPQIALSGWQEGTSLAAYKMIVGSHNSATGTVLAESGRDVGSWNPLDDFNAFLHDIIGLPPTVGLTEWNYGATQDTLSFTVERPDPAYDPERISANTITLDALVSLYEFLETPNWVEGAISRAIATEGYPLRLYESPEAYRADVLAAIEEAKLLMAIPDPEIPTELELSLARVQAEHPELEIDMYGKNGLLRPTDWPGDRWHVNEAAVVRVRQGERSVRCIIAYSASNFEVDHLLDGALRYCVALFEQDVAVGG